MQQMRLDLAGDYLVMATMLAEIKSRMLLPRPDPDEEDEDDPRAVLIRRLQEYERFKNAAESLDMRPRLERDLHLAYAAVEDPIHPRSLRKYHWMTWLQQCAWQCWRRRVGSICKWFPRLFQFVNG